MLPPDNPVKLWGRPKKLRRKEEWEGGSRTRSSHQERVTDHVPNIERFGARRIIHGSICRKEGHRKNKCPDKPTVNEENEDATVGTNSEANGSARAGNENGASEGASKRPKLKVRRPTKVVNSNLKFMPTSGFNNTLQWNSV